MGVVLKCRKFEVFVRGVTPADVACQAQKMALYTLVLPPSPSRRDGHFSLFLDVIYIRGATSILM